MTIIRASNIVYCRLARSELQAKTSINQCCRLLTATTQRQKRALEFEKNPQDATVVTDTPIKNEGNETKILGGIALLALTCGGAYYFLYPPDGKKSDKDVVEVKQSRDVELSSDAVGTTLNRVTQIEVPSKMKREASSELKFPSISHPDKGNRVSTFVPTTSSNVKEEISMTDALSKTERAVSELKASSQNNKQEDAGLMPSIGTTGWTLGDLDTMSSAQMKLHIIHLSSELNDRTKWEAVRLNELLSMKEKELMNKHLENLQKQRFEFEDLLAKKLREYETNLQRQFQQALQEKDASIQQVIAAALEAKESELNEEKRLFEETTLSDMKLKFDEEFTSHVEEQKRQFELELQEKVNTLLDLRKKVDFLHEELESSKISKEGSSKAHKVSAAALALAGRLETSQSAQAELKSLQESAGKEGVISTAISTIPLKAVQVGVPTLPHLQARFDNVYKKCRQAVLVPQGRSGLEGQLVGTLFSVLKYAPDPNSSSENVVNDPEYLLVRAKKFVQLGELEQAVEELEKLPNAGQLGLVLRDWKKDAVNRIAIDKALKVIRMECALLNESCI